MVGEELEKSIAELAHLLASDKALAVASLASAQAGKVGDEHD